jgi:hypothetical protein
MPTLDTNAELLRKAAIQTSGFGGQGNAGGVELNNEQAQEFIRRVFEATPMLQMSRRVTMNARKMNIDKINIQNRVLRRKPEGTATNTFNPIKYEQVVLSATAMQFPWELTREALLFSIERGNLEDTVMALMTKQLAKDMNELAWNGDNTLAGATIASATPNTAAGGNQTGIAISGVTSGRMATITSATAHGLAAGDTVTLSGFTSTQAGMNSTWVVESVPSTTTYVIWVGETANTDAATGLTGALKPGGYVPRGVAYHTPSPWLLVTDGTNFPDKGTVYNSTQVINYDGKSGNKLLHPEGGVMDSAAAVIGSNATITLLTSTDPSGTVASYPSMLVAQTGWLKRIRLATPYQYVDVSGTGDGVETNGNIQPKIWTKLYYRMPSNYRSAFADQLRWFVHPVTHFAWNDYLVRNRTALESVGGRALLANANNPNGSMPVADAPYGIPIVEDPNLPTDKIVLSYPENFIIGIVAGQDIRISRDMTSKDVISRGVVYYQVDLMSDLQVERPDAAVVGSGLVDLSV